MARSTGGLEYFGLFSKPLYDVINALAASGSETPFRPSFALILFGVEFDLFIFTSFLSVGPTAQIYRYAASQPPYSWSVPPRLLDFRALLLAALYIRSVEYRGHLPIPLPMSDIERQIKLEADARYEGMLRYAKNREYQLATDLKPARDLLSNSVDSLSDAILQHQMELRTSRYKKL